uniref:Uncharacterized protein n=1 Tax=Trichuris muris TaxID=70415 RepID=A0A5S6Q9J1_TRIMR
MFIILSALVFLMAILGYFVTERVLQWKRGIELLRRQRDGADDLESQAAASATIDLLSGPVANEGKNIPEKSCENSKRTFVNNPNDDRAVSTGVPGTVGSHSHPKRLHDQVACRGRDVQCSVEIEVDCVTTYSAISSVGWLAAMEDVVRVCGVKSERLISMQQMQENKSVQNGK